MRSIFEVWFIELFSAVRLQELFQAIEAETVLSVEDYFLQTKKKDWMKNFYKFEFEHKMWELKLHYMRPRLIASSKVIDTQKAAMSIAFGAFKIEYIEQGLTSHEQVQLYYNLRNYENITILAGTDIPVTLALLDSPNILIRNKKEWTIV